MTNQRFSTSEPYEYQGYNPGHPWYYFLGGRPKRLKEILEATRACGYQGYARQDISRYRECVRELRRTDWELPQKGVTTASLDIHTALSLKHNHIANHFGHLIYLDELLSQQLDLFDF